MLGDWILSDREWYNALQTSMSHLTACTGGNRKVIAFPIQGGKYCWSQGTLGCTAAVSFVDIPRLLVLSSPGCSHLGHQLIPVGSRNMKRTGTALDPAASEGNRSSFQRQCCRSMQLIMTCPPAMLLTVDWWLWHTHRRWHVCR